MQKVTYEEGKELFHTRVCGECGAFLTHAWGGSLGIDGYVVFCTNNPHHQGFVKQAPFQRKCFESDGTPVIVGEDFTSQRRQEMTEELGEAKSTALAPFQGITALSRKDASLILRTIWPGAPDDAVLKAAITCAQYGLNPLMKHLFLVKFATKSGDKWEPILGITATRLIASRKTPYSYKDGPRMMTDEEQQSIFGEVDPNNFRAITVIEDAQGHQAPGYGLWPKDVEPYGVDKGNSKSNMAFKRSEKEAFDRLLPGEMPTGIEVMDTDFIEGDFKVVEEEKPKTEKPKAKAPDWAKEGSATAAQVKAIFTIGKELGFDEETVKEKIMERCHLENFIDLSKEDASEIITEFQRAQKASE